MNGDEDEDDFKVSNENIPWVSVAFENVNDDDERDKITDVIDCEGMPTIGIINGSSGQVIFDEAKGY